MTSWVSGRWHEVVAAGFLSHYLSCRVTVNKNVLSVSLNKTFHQ